jgi:hypothetical protein
MTAGERAKTGGLLFRQAESKPRRFEEFSKNY